MAPPRRRHERHGGRRGRPQAGKNGGGKKGIVFGGKTERGSLDARKEGKRARPRVIVLRAGEPVQGTRRGVVEVAKRPAAGDALPVDAGGGLGKTRGDQK